VKARVTHALAPCDILTACNKRSRHGHTLDATWAQADGSVPSTWVLSPHHLTTTMNSSLPLEAAAPLQVSDSTIAHWIGQTFELAPDTDRRQLLVPLLRPLGLLSLAAVAGGVFTRIRLNSAWPELRVPGVDLGRLRGSDVAALADHVQQVSVESVDSLAQVLAQSPVLAGSALTALLITVLLQRAHARRGRTRRASDHPAPVTGRSAL
jgi:hypothetical protein